MTRPATAALIVLVLLLAACGSAPQPEQKKTPEPAQEQSPGAVPPTPSPAPPGASTAKPIVNTAPMEACKLLTSEEAQAALGETVGPPNASQHISGGSSCSFLTNATNQLPRTAIVVVWPAAYTMKQLQDSLTPYVKTPPKIVTGIGDEAFWMADSLYVRKNKIIFSIAVANLRARDEAALLGSARRLAQKASARVP